jgi:hypothetical protein
MNKYQEQLEKAKSAANSAWSASNSASSEELNWQIDRVLEVLNHE